jgi:putative adenylate-forming enzyme
MNLFDRYKLSIINLILKIQQLTKAQAMDPQQLKNLQNKRFKKILKHAVLNSDFYRDYYTDHGINIGDLDEISIEDLPIINKKIMMENFDRFVCDDSLKKADLEEFASNPNFIDKKYKGKYEVINTSGSSGEIGIFVYGPNDWSIIKALVFTRVSRNRIYFNQKIKYAFIGITDAHDAGISIARDSPKIFFDFLPIDITKPIFESIESINSFMPEILCGYSSGIHLFALEQLKGNLMIHPKRIICSSDPLTANAANTIYDAFKIKPVNFYAASESLGMAVQCDYFNGLHMFNDLHIFESIKQNGERSKLGEPGNLVITTLYNYTQPLIRYRMDDIVVMDDKGCQCKWSFPLLGKIIGREEEMLVFEIPNGEKITLHPIIFIEFIVPGLVKIQFIQVEKYKLRINAVVNEDADKAAATTRIKNKMDVILKTKELADFISCEINLVEDIPIDPKTGKYRLIIPLK